MKAENRRLAAIRYKLHRKIGSYRSDKRALRRQHKENTWRLRADTLQLLQKDDMLALLVQISPSIQQRTDDFSSMAKLSLEEFQGQLRLDLGPDEDMPQFVHPAAAAPQIPSVPDQQLPELPLFLADLPDLPGFAPMDASLANPPPPQPFVFSASTQRNGAPPRRVHVAGAAQNTFVQPPVTNAKRARAS